MMVLMSTAAVWRCTTTASGARCVPTDLRMKKLGQILLTEKSFAQKGISILTVSFYMQMQNWYALSVNIDEN